MSTSFNYHQAPAYSYAVIDPKKFRFANAPRYRPPTPPIHSPPKDPNAPEEPEEKEEPASEDSKEDTKLEDTGDKPPDEVGMLLSPL